VIAGLFTLQAALVLYVPGQTTFQMLIVLLSQLALIYLFILNRRIPGAKLFALGVILNTTVMAANGGWMPITPEAYGSIQPYHVVEVQGRAPTSKGIMLPLSETNLWILSDIIKAPLPGAKSVMSIGDIVIILGVAQFLFQNTKKRQPPSQQPNVSVTIQ
jgi:hypothetical protein